jgi:hypothetical protein
LDSGIEDVRFHPRVQFQFPQDAVGEEIPIVASGCLKPFKFALYVFVIPLQELERSLLSCPARNRVRLSTPARPSPG